MSAQSLSFIPALSQVSPLVLRVLGCNPGPMTLQGTNTYLIGNGQRRLLVDTGDGKEPDYVSNLEKTLKEHSVSLSGIVLTHWHHDHIGGVGPIWNKIKPDCALYKFPRADAPDPTFDCSPVTLVKDGHTFEVDGATLKAIHTPGHATDHIILHLQEENAIFSGDCILGEGTAVFEDLHTYMNSLDRILKIGPKVIYPAHGAVIDDPVKKIEYYIQHRNQRESQILEVLKTNSDKAMNAMEIVKIVYVETPESLHLAAAKNVSHHLSKLVKEDKIEEIGESAQFKIRSSL